MPKFIRSLKLFVAMLALGLTSVVSSNAEAGDMDSKGLLDLTRKALQDDEVLQKVAYYAYSHDGKIGEAVKGSYEVNPEQIIPWSVSGKTAVSVVKVKTTRAKKTKMYTFAFVFSPEGLDPVLLYPGTSNTDPTLFSDIFAPAKGYAQGVLKSKEVDIKDTKVIGGIRSSGWDEEWLWVNEKGKSYTMKITFSTSPAGGTNWNIKGLKN
jgi:hypothetical protein